MPDATQAFDSTTHSNILRLQKTASTNTQTHQCSGPCNTEHEFEARKLVVTDLEMLLVALELLHQVLELVDAVRLLPRRDLELRRGRRRLVLLVVELLFELL